MPKLNSWSIERVQNDRSNQCSVKFIVELVFLQQIDDELTLFDLEVVNVELSVLRFDDNTSESIVEIARTFNLPVELEEHVENFTQKRECKIVV